MYFDPPATPSKKLVSALPYLLVLLLYKPPTPAVLRVLSSEFKKHSEMIIRP
jgi:hypothetical protein